MTFHSYNFLSQNFESACIFIYIPIAAFLRIVADPHHFNADSRIHLFIKMQIRIRLLHFNADPDLTPHQSDANLRPSVCRCQYETPHIENDPAVYNSPCLCYPLYNILLNKILLMGNGFDFQSVYNLPEHNVPVLFFPDVQTALNRVILYSCLKMKE